VNGGDGGWERVDGAGARRLRNETAEDMDAVRVWGGLRLPGLCIVGGG